MPSFKTNTKSFLFDLLFSPIFLVASGTEQHNIVQNQAYSTNTTQLNHDKNLVTCI